MNNNWGTYRNGNYTVALNLENGTKVRYNDADQLIPSTIENFDYKITSRCDGGCPFCFESSTPNGKHGDIMNQKFIDSLHPYTEIAIGGGNPLCHPQLIPFLEKCKSLKLVPSITINQLHFDRMRNLVDRLVTEKLIYGMGISLMDPNKQFLNDIKEYPNAVIHIINGVITENQLGALLGHNLKILILGYKEVGKGKALYSRMADVIEDRKWSLKGFLPSILREGFSAISFDNRALEQLDVKSFISPEQWNLYYMGDDGMNGSYSSASMFVDGVRKEFALNSCSRERFPLLSTAEEMFQTLMKKYGKNS